MTGSTFYLVDGLISDAGKQVADGVKRHGWYDASTLKEPYRIEGKKTMGLELAEQFQWQLPDVIVYPTGGGVGLIGIHKVFRELRELGWLDRPFPRMVAVQSSGCAPIVRAWEAGRRESEFWTGARTVAFGITVPKALGDFLVLDALYDTNGCAVETSDEEILQAQRLLARSEGTFICPEGGGHSGRSSETESVGLDQARREGGPSQHRIRAQVSGVRVHVPSRPRSRRLTAGLSRTLPAEETRFRRETVPGPPPRSRKFPEGAGAG